MSFADSFKNRVHSLTFETFEDAALDAFYYQWHENTVYQQYAKALKKHPNNVSKLKDIPFLPISFFKSHRIKAGDWREESFFLSSGTTSARARSCHLVKDMGFYLRNAHAGFEYHFGSISELTLLALLPSYQSQGNSSLVAMVDHFIRLGKFHSQYLKQGHFSLDIPKTEPIVLIGVSYALLDAQKFPKYSNLMVMETGGMKGRRKEMIRPELHEDLKNIFDANEIASEYGMTELLSQAYALKNGKFKFPPWAKAIVRDIHDPFSMMPKGKAGGLNIVDLANIDTCCFIETQDLGKKITEFEFEILGRFDNADLRGCNLMAQ